MELEPTPENTNKITLPKFINLNEVRYWKAGNRKDYYEAKKFCEHLGALKEDGRSLRRSIFGYFFYDGYDYCVFGRLTCLDPTYGFCYSEFDVFMNNFIPIHEIIKLPSYKSSVYRKNTNKKPKLLKVSEISEFDFNCFDFFPSVLKQGEHHSFN